MDLKSRREEIRKIYFSTGGLCIVTVLGIVGLLFIVFSGIFKVKNFEMLYQCISANGITVIFGSFFFIISLYCWLAFIRNIIVKPKKEVLYLYKNDEDETYFLNKKGKKFFYENCDKEEGKYYFVLKTKDYIYDVLEECEHAIDDFTTKEKKSYWLNFYSPLGKYENIFLLPIVYIILLPGVLSSLMSKGFYRIYGLIYSAIPLFIIVYDVIYKIKLSKSEDGYVDESKLLYTYDLLRKSALIISTSIICIVFLGIFIKLQDLTSRLIFAPFLGCGVCTFGCALSKVFNLNELEKIFHKSYIIIFLIFWFGLLIFWTVGIIKQEGDFRYTLFSIPFWIAGIFIIYKFFIKDK